MNAPNGRVSIASVAPTLAALMGVPAPGLCACQPITSVLEAAARVFDGGRAQKCIVLAPDAFGDHLSEVCRPAFRHFVDATVTVPVRSVLPPKTPVCYASIFTGAEPAAHGIRRYEKPVLKCDTLFDALVRAGRRVAIVAVQGCSVDMIFRDRAIDYFSEKYDPQVAGRAIELLEKDAHDVLIVYMQGYDDTMHRFGPLSDAALASAVATAENCAVVQRAFDRSWAAYDRALLVAPDHGAHTTSDGGSHGEDVPEDMFLRHFYCLRPGSKAGGKP